MSEPREPAALAQGPDLVPISWPALQALQEDARRYRYLKHWIRARPNPQGDPHWVVHAQAIRYTGATPDEAIDRHLAEETEAQPSVGRPEESTR